MRLSSKIGAIALVSVALLAALSDRFLAPALLLLLADFVWRRRTKARILLARTPLDLSIGVLTGMLGLTLWVTSLPQLTLPAVARTLTGLLFYFTFTSRFPRAPFRPFEASSTDPASKNSAQTTLLRDVIGKIIPLSAFGLGIAALFSVDWYDDKLTFLPVGFFQALPHLPDTVQPNVMSGALLLLVPIPLALFLFGSWLKPSRRLSISKVLYGFLGLFLILLIGLTKSRGSYLGLAAGLAVLAGLRWGWRGWLASALAAALAIAFLIYDPSIRTIVATESNSAAGTAAGRLDIWSRALYMLEDFPLTGIGMGTFTQVADTLYPFFIASPGSITHAHNLYLQVGVDLGLPGLAAWLAALMGSLWAAWRSFRATPPGNTPLRAPAAALLAAFTGLLVHGLFDAVTWGTRPAILVWGLMALAISLYQGTNPVASDLAARGEMRAAPTHA